MDQVKQMGNVLGGMERRGQFAVVAVAIVTALMLFFVVKAATHTSWSTVRDGIRPEQAGAVTKALDGAKVANQTINGGTTVQVASGDMSKARVALAQANLLGTGGGHTTCEQIYGKSSTFGGSTSDMQRVNAQACLQNSIANDIEGIQGVNSASVHVNQASSQLFTSEATKPTAAVTVDTGGQSLDKQQVKAIAALTASSVQGMDPSDVTIVDEQGTLLTDNSGNGGSGATFTDTQLKMRVEAAYNQSLEQKLLDQFGSVVGPNNIRVISNAELDMDQIRKEVKTYGYGANHTGGPVQSKDVGTEILTGPGATVGGAAGTATNIPNAGNTTPAAGTATNGQKYTHDTGKYIYNNDEVAQAILVAPGAVKRDNMAVFVDKSVDSTTAGQIFSAAKSLTGNDATDNINTSQVTFSKTKAAKPGLITKPVLDYVKWAILGLGMIAMAFFLRRGLMSRTQELLNPGDELLMLERSVDPIPLKELEAAVNAASSIENQKRLELQRKVENIAANKPADVAQQLRGWLHEGDPYRSR